MSRYRRPLIDEETSQVSCGPITFDVTDARRAGWTEKMINRAYERIAAVLKKEFPLARRRRPDLYRQQGDTWIFVGETPDGPALTREQKSRMGLAPDRRARATALATRKKPPKKWAPHPNCVARSHSGNAPCICTPAHKAVK